MPVSEIEERIICAFIRQLNQYDYAKINITGLCADAGINRTTFYLYYQSKADLAEAICYDCIQGYIDLVEVVLSDLSGDVFKKNLAVSYAFIRKNADLLRALWRIWDTAFSPYLIMQQSLYDVVMRKIASRSPADSVNQELFAHSFAASAMANIQYYLDHNCSNLDAVIHSAEAGLHRGAITLLYPQLSTKQESRLDASRAPALPPSAKFRNSRHADD